MNDWIEGDWATVKAGQRVKLENTDGTVEFDVEGSCQTRDCWQIKSAIGTYSEWGWNLFVTAPSKPTERGWYVDEAPTIWRLSGAGNWHAAEKNSEPLADWELDLLVTGNLTRLESRADTAKAIVAALRNNSNSIAGGCETVAPIGNEAIDRAANWIESEYGVEL